MNPQEELDRYEELEALGMSVLDLKLHFEKKSADPRNSTPEKIRTQLDK